MPMTTSLGSWRQSITPGPRAGRARGRRRDYN